MCKKSERLLKPGQAQPPNEMAVAVITAAIFTKARRKRNLKKSGEKIRVSYNTITKAGVLLMTIPNIYFFY